MMSNGMAKRCRHILITTSALLLLTLFAIAPMAWGQSKVSLQVKAFDQKLQPLKNVDFGFNNLPYFRTNTNGQAIVELDRSELPIRNVRMKDEKVEVASWSLSKGTVEIIVRPKIYKFVKFAVRLADGTALANTMVKFNGTTALSAVTNNEGRFELRLGVDESIASENQFAIEDMTIRNLALSSRENILTVERVRPREVAPRQIPATKPSTNTVQRNVTPQWNVSALDTLKNLGEFYALFRSVPTAGMNENTRARIDRKLRELVAAREDSIVAHNARASKATVPTLTDSTRPAESRPPVSAANDTSSNAPFLLIASIVVLLAILIGVVVAFTGRLRNQRNALEKANQEIVQINENVDTMVKRRTRVLEQANKEFGAFLHKTSHVLRAPIQTIVGLCSKEKSMTMDELATRVAKTASAMDRVMNKLVDISEIGVAAKVIRNTDIFPLIDAVCDKQLGAAHEGNTLSDDLEGRTIDIDIECPQDLCFKTSPTLLEVILSNLVENAVYFSALKPDDKTQVQVKAEVRHEDLVITVYDNGPGIADSMKPQLFGMFFSGNEQSKRAGLGLYAVQKSVDALNGQVRIESEEGRFTRVTAIIPPSFHGRRDRTETNPINVKQPEPVR
jgi:signal transduction histidine kinase